VLTVQLSEVSIMLDLGALNRQWRPPIIRTITIDGSGTDEMYAAIQQHREFLEESGQISRFVKKGPDVMWLT
jgi:LAO/AO transport system kinase